MTLAAVALQDHMTRSLSLQDPFKKKKVNHSLPVVTKNNAELRQNLNAKERKSNKEDFEKEEYVLDPKPAPLTLGTCT